MNIQKISETVSIVDNYDFRISELINSQYVHQRVATTSDINVLTFGTSGEDYLDTLIKYIEKIYDFENNGPIIFSIKRYDSAMEAETSSNLTINSFDDIYDIVDVIGKFHKNDVQHTLKFEVFNDEQIKLEAMFKITSLQAKEYFDLYIDYFKILSKSFIRQLAITLVNAKYGFDKKSVPAIIVSSNEILGKSVFKSIQQLSTKV